MQLKWVMQVSLACALVMSSTWVLAGKGSSSSMSRGFSSSRSTPSIKAPARPSSFGSFGRAQSQANSPRASSVRSESVMYRDISQRHAQTNATKNWDARQASDTSTGSIGSSQAAGNSSSNTSTQGTRFGNQTTMNKDTSYQTGTQVGNQVGTQFGSQTNDRNAMLKGAIAGVVIGSVLSQPHSAYGSTGHPNSSGQSTEGMTNGPVPVTEQGEFKQSQIKVEQPMESTELPTNAAQSAQQVVEHAGTQDVTPKSSSASSPSDSSSSLGTWVILLALLGALIWWTKRRLNKVQSSMQTGKPHYSL
ncbi:hypothetical protein RF679_01480 [Undibacterium cyanobacteriorum]|uniref:Glycine zipper domain-containing protein n=1 Tax=Undibacterium cyanobacteriorum TaxID=3073561 RepID=A0ABY9RJH9_9BURK|nr:hypothetical protein [Undibacterium sp. 20NA77.5]WMW80968.1 hypothetical protein RF679_01480 [Undibacterium sp. 20NA77.5]